MLRSETGSSSHQENWPSDAKSIATTGHEAEKGASTAESEVITRRMIGIAEGEGMGFVP